MAKKTPVLRFDITVEYTPFEGEETTPENVWTILNSLSDTMNFRFTDGSSFTVEEVSEPYDADDEDDRSLVEGRCSDG